ncbi:response regulator [Pseudoalteromonas denitrificans]|uniref:Response regulator receiver domain-containing protein n=1 Tax=Pseudoalteromonas denitrificans DSM 6059 TaxID=1123010 RepID=A0A1I1MQH4_9GAMM|nr:response regulator [Pseudoalteromonas denitrificans]SFC87425.1 Response regulator receiver domain-containing protein [Pseudoalteromonas denitrificans DSM 6059]
MRNSILVVDDIEGVRREITYLLEEENYLVTQAENGKEAMNILTQQNIHLVITDILMPEMDGFELCKFLENNFPEISIIIISGGGSTYKKNINDLDRLLTQAQKLTQAKVILKKPFSSEKLLSKVNFLLNK